MKDYLLPKRDRNYIRTMKSYQLKDGSLILGETKSPDQDRFYKVCTGKVTDNDDNLIVFADDEHRYCALQKESISTQEESDSAQ